MKTARPRIPSPLETAGMVAVADRDLAMLRSAPRPNLVQQHRTDPVRFDWPAAPSVTCPLHVLLGSCAASQDETGFYWRKSN